MPTTRAGHRLGRRGFTLMEVALATIIIGLGMTAMMELLAAGTLTNQNATDTTIAMNLARNIRELSMNLAFAEPGNATHWGLETGETIYAPDDLDDLDGAVYSPQPIDAMCNRLTDLTGWNQSVSVQNVDPLNPWRDQGTGTITGMRRITVTIRHNNVQVYQTSWLACQAMP